MIRVVIDANAIISGLVSVSAPPGQVLDAWHDGRFKAVFSVELSTEVLGVMARPHLVPRYRRPQSDIDEFRSLITDAGRQSHLPMGDVRDPNDRHVLGAAYGLHAR